MGEKEALTVEDRLKALRARFPDACYGKLFKAYNKDEARSARKAKCSECGSFHSTAPGVHLDYVGHGVVTGRLLDVDPHWNWEPLATDDLGLPRFERAAAGNPMRLWIKLTVCGVTRLGVGSVEPGAFDPEKQLIGDAIRNAAMRFGVALDLWSKEELESEVDSADVSPVRQEKREAAPRARPVGQDSPKVQAMDARDADKTRENVRMAGEVNAFGGSAERPEDAPRFQAEEERAPSMAEARDEKRAPVGKNAPRTAPMNPDFSACDLDVPPEISRDVRTFAHERFGGGKHKGKDWVPFLQLRAGSPDPEDLFGYLRWMVNRTAEKAVDGGKLYKGDWYAVVVMQYVRDRWSDKPKTEPAMHAVASNMFGAEEIDGENEASRYD